MVPTHDYDFGVTELMRALSETRGARDEPLLGTYTLRSYVADEAVDKLIFRLVEDARRDRTFAQQFSRTAAWVAYGEDDLFQIHRGKAPQHFWDELTKLQTAWQAPFRIPGTIQRDEEWMSVHPLLGEAFMSTIALAVAQENGMDVITEKPSAHRALACHDDNAVYDLLISQRSRHKTITSKIRKLFAPESENSEKDQETVRRVVHLIIVSNFDVTALNATDLAAMSKNREALFDFRRYLAKRVAEIPNMTSDFVRERRLRAVAEETIDEWRKTIPTFTRFARRFFGLGLLDKSEKAMTDLAKSLIPGSLTGAAMLSGGVGYHQAAAALLSAPLIAAAPGLAVALAVYGVKTWRGLKDEETEGPLRYLSLLEKQGATLLFAAPPTADEDPRLR